MRLATTIAVTGVEGRPWLGVYHLVAVYDFALDGAQVAQNFAAGP